MWSTMNQLYSFCLVSLGAAYTFFLRSTREDDDNNNDPDGRRLWQDGQRWLAAAGASSAEEEEMKLERAAHIFSVSLAMLFFSLDVMPILHLGLKESYKRCVAETTKETNYTGICLLFLRFGLLVFTATLSQWEGDPTNLTFVGLLLVATELMLRRLGQKFLSQDMAKVTKGNGTESTWPNVTHARAERSELK